MHLWQCGRRIDLRMQEAKVGAKRVPAATVVVIIIGGDTVVGRALESLLRSADYRVRFLAEPPSEEPELLDDAQLLLLAPGLDAEHRESTLRLVGDHPAESMPVLELVADAEVAQATGRFLPWPCRAEDLQRHIRAALSPGLTVSRSGQALRALKDDR